MAPTDGVHRWLAARSVWASTELHDSSRRRARVRSSPQLSAGFQPMAAYGGGVSEPLRSAVLLLRDLGLSVACA
jgi:hypothetical protein